MATVEPVAFSVVGLDRRIIEGDDVILKMLGFDASDLIGRDALSFTHQDDLAISRKALDDLIRLGRGFRITKRFIRADGKVIWIQNCAA